MTKATNFIISATGSIIGVVANVKNATLEEGSIVVKTGEDMKDLSLGQLTAIYNAATGKENKKFSIAKDKAIEKVMAALEAVDVTKLVQLDAAEKEKVETAAKSQAPRKERDSALQRMKRAFLEKTEDGRAFVTYTIKELMEKCNVTEKIAHQYISILRAMNDRFVMNIVKTKEEKDKPASFQYQPREGQPLSKEVAKHFAAQEAANAPDASAAA